MVDDFLHDPVLATKVILGISSPPHMELRLWSMWTKAMVIDSSGFGTGKSLDIAIISALRAILMRDRTIAIVSRTFRQGQDVHQYLNDWAKRKPIFRSQLINDGGRGSSTQTSSLWERKFVSGSVVRTLPPDFKGGAEGMGSEDWTDASFDEVTKYPDLTNFFRQLVSRVRKPIPPEYRPMATRVPVSEDPILGRHIYMCGTARYVWHPFFNQIKQFNEKIKDGSSIHDVLSFNYKDIIRFFDLHEEYKEFVPLQTIRTMEGGLPRDIVEQEVNGIWTTDSAGFYSMADVMAARGVGCPVLVGRE